MPHTEPEATVTSTVVAVICTLASELGQGVVGWTRKILPDPQTFRLFSLQSYSQATLNWSQLISTSETLRVAGMAAISSHQMLLSGPDP